MQFFSCLSLLGMGLSLATANDSPPPPCILKCNPSRTNKCDQRACGDGAVCLANKCNQRGLVNPTCTGVKCDQSDSVNPRCLGGKCNQQNSTSPSCIGHKCNQAGSKIPTCAGTKCNQDGSLNPSCQYGCSQHGCTGTLQCSKGDCDQTDSGEDVSCKGGGCCYATPNTAGYPGTCTGGRGNQSRGNCCCQKAKSCSAKSVLVTGNSRLRRNLKKEEVGFASAMRDDDSGDVFLEYVLNFEVPCPGCRIAIYSPEAELSDIESNKAEDEMELISFLISSIADIEGHVATGTVFTEDSELNTIGAYVDSYIVLYTAEGNYVGHGVFEAGDGEDSQEGKKGKKESKDGKSKVENKGGKKSKKGN